MTSKERLSVAVNFLSQISPHNLWTTETWILKEPEFRRLSDKGMMAVDAIVQARLAVEFDSSEKL
jgi:hypothetical protein